MPSAHDAAKTSIGNLTHHMHKRQICMGNISHHGVAYYGISLSHLLMLSGCKMSCHENMVEILTTNLLVNQLVALLLIITSVN